MELTKLSHWFLRCVLIKTVYGEVRLTNNMQMRLCNRTRTNSDLILFPTTMLRRIDRAIVRLVSRCDPQRRNGIRCHRRLSSSSLRHSLPLRQLQPIQSRHRGCVIVVAAGTSGGPQSVSLPFHARYMADSNDVSKFLYRSFIPF